VFEPSDKDRKEYGAQYPEMNPDFAVEWNSDKVSYIWIWNTTIPIN
jgi:hypothetical protein